MDNKLREFVDKNIFCQLNDIVSDLIEVGKIDIYEYLIQETEYDGEIITIHDRYLMIQELHNKILEEGIEDIQPILDKINYLNNDMNWNYPEIFEYYGVNNFFAKKLKEKGEVIIYQYNLKIWGRKKTGQAVFLDNIIQEIYKELQEK